jgi:hypothetical protein
LFEDILQQRFFKWLQLAKWSGMDGFLLGFQQSLDGIVAETEALRPPCQKQSRNLDTFWGLTEQNSPFVLEMLRHCEESKLVPCSVLHAHPLQNVAWLGKTWHGI